MPHRLFAFVEYPKSFLIGVVSSTGSLFATITNEKAMGVALAVVAIGSVLAGPLRKLYQGIREAKLEADTKEYDTIHEREQSTATKLGLALGRLEAAEEQIKELRAQNASQQEQLNQAKKLGKYAAKTAVKLEEKVNDNATRLATVEAVQGSLSGDAIPTPVPPEPKS